MPLGQNRNRNAVNFWVLLKHFESVHDNRAAMDLKELLRAGTGLHTGADSTREYDCNVRHILIPPG